MERPCGTFGAAGLHHPLIPVIPPATTPQKRQGKQPAAKSVPASIIRICRVSTRPSGRTYAVISVITTAGTIGIAAHGPPLLSGSPYTVCGLYTTSECIRISSYHTFGIDPAQCTGREPGQFDLYNNRTTGGYR